YHFLETHLVAAQCQALQSAMRGMQYSGSRSLVDFAGLDANQAILDMIDPPDAILSCKLVQTFDQRNAFHLFAVQGYGDAVLKGNLHIAGLCCGLALKVGTDRPGVDLLWRLCPGVFQDAALDAASPEVLIDRIRAGIG